MNAINFNYDKDKSDLAARQLKYGEQLLALGVTGSTAYGLANENSDEDQMGIYIVPTRKLFSFDFNVNKASRVSNDPDIQMHEIGKYINLALSGNPTITEVMYLNEYLYFDGLLEPLVENRHKMSGSIKVKGAYVGYAVAQANRLVNRQENGRKGFNSDLAKRTAKHGRHCFRLMLQAEQLLTEGVVKIDVSDHRDELFAMGELAETNPEEFLRAFESRKNFIDSIDPVIPPEPDKEWAEKYLTQVRIDNLEV